MHNLPYDALLHKIVGVISLILSVTITVNYRRIFRWSIQRAEKSLTRKGLAWQLPFARTGGPIWLVGAIIALALLGIQFLFFPV